MSFIGPESPCAVTRGRSQLLGNNVPSCCSTMHGPAPDGAAHRLVETPVSTLGSTGKSLHFPPGPVQHAPSASASVETSASAMSIPPSVPPIAPASTMVPPAPVIAPPARELAPPAPPAAPDVPPVARGVARDAPQPPRHTTIAIPSIHARSIPRIPNTSLADDRMGGVYG